MRVKLHFLITAGGTREYIDPVRFISNASSGKMGFALARAAAKAGHKVTLITTVEKAQSKIHPSSLTLRRDASRISNLKLKIVKVVSADEMFEAVKREFGKCDCLIMAAAVSDYKPLKKSKIKIRKSGKNLVMKLKPTADILKWAGKNKKKNQITVGFALEDKNLRTNAKKKLKEKNLDMIILNSPSAIGAEKSKVEIKPAGRGWMRLADMEKSKSAARILKHINRCFER